MKTKFILVASVAACSFVFGQNTPSKLIPGKDGLHAEFMRFDKNAPTFQGSPVLFDETSQRLAPGQARKLGLEKDALGFETHRFQQTVNNIPVEYGMMAVQTKGGKIVGQSGNWILKVPEKAEKKANISESIALQNALSFVGADSYKWENKEEEDFIKRESGNADASFVPKGELVYYSDPSDDKLTDLVLAYKFDIYAEKPLSRQYVFVDAKNGKVLGTNAIIHEVNTPGTATTAYSGNRNIVADSYNGSYRLRETGRNGGTAVETYNLKKGTNYSSAVDFTDTDNVWNNVNINKDQYATDAHWGAEMTLDYYFTKFGRKSIDNNNFAIKSYVHYSTNYFNASWDGSRMTYGDGNANNGNKPLTAIDVCGHEITHGMTSKTANLVYEREPGALNEGFSDIFGNTIERWARPSQASWTIGEDFNYVIRDMANPNAFKQPDTYKGTYWKDVSTTGCAVPNRDLNDYCGVHTNSGVLNFWYYLLVTGGTGANDNGFAYNVSGVGLDKAGAIAYRTLTTYLTSASTYANARTYSLQAATDLYGAGSNEVTQVTNAWNAVGVGGGTSAAGLIASASKVSPYTISPNPATDRFTVEFEAKAGNGIVELVSLTGKRELSEKVNLTDGGNRINIQLPSNILPGVYVVTVNGQKAGNLIKK
ncbi:M4 family metallopeptidase [Chryseobacterium rhizosphaerae]|uniref:Neutral metalloproteinase n=1 Tax=Chryseobacterium rhizosphaerae TaxID=395937 RepID=A0ABX9IFV3_9FLAO|nr:M4 family metallopeptidase [Chryseobacterium rhizosphaerae]MDR6547513.1 Zn-dependent metalloprotease [Chryseobacterium rhizosphaerae]REC71483.1 T9SS C-terminal target domain-containing protein [Chryseobacterium rhizosphaerae]GEN68194.1 bacillolysin [Chryseobacterium rhizosphaerae]